MTSFIQQLISTENLLDGCLDGMIYMAFERLKNPLIVLLKKLDSNDEASADY